MKTITSYSLLLLISLLVSSCSVVGGIFKAGMGVGVFLSVLFVAGIIFLVVKMSGKNK